MKIYIKEQLAQVELEMIQHFEEYGLNWDNIYLDTDYFPKPANELEEAVEFTKWFYYFQGQYHKLQDILKFLNE